MNINDLSIEALESCYWDDMEFDSYVIKTAQAARKKPLSKLSKEEIRLLISQKIGLKYVIPKAIDILEQNLFIEVCYYEGDLLASMLNLSFDDWSDNYDSLRSFQMLLEKNIASISICEEISSDLVKKVLMFT